MGELDELLGLIARMAGSVECICPDVVECAVIGATDAERGQIVQAHVVLAEGAASDDATRLRLQDHVKATIAPYKYPRSIKFVTALPKTQTGKVQRLLLRSQP